MVVVKERQHTAAVEGGVDRSVVDATVVVVSGTGIDRVPRINGEEGVKKEKKYSKYMGRNKNLEYWEMVIEKVVGIHVTNNLFLK
ncbi:hypothetical protein Tco_0685525 [Tanacetum coccineum]